MKPKAFIQTFGCQMNEHDSQHMMAVLAQAGYEAASSEADATLVILNTCSVRHNPENKVFSQLGRLRALKRGNPSLVIGVGGCVAQQEGEAILRREKAVDLVFGPDNYFRLPEMLAEVAEGKRVLMTGWQARPPDRVVNFVPEEYLDRGHVEQGKAYIAITKGCDNFCSFCIVPRTRGREVSREPEHVLREARELIGHGARELWLLGQNVNSYRACGVGFEELLDAVSGLEGLARLRFTSPHPNDWTDSLSDLMAARDTICNHLHLPFQAGSDRVLEQMRRGHTVADYLAKVRYMRRVNPGIELTTDLIVGFPTETDDDFRRTLDVLEEVRYSQVFAFMYSPRPGTRAARMPDDVAREVKEARLQEVIAVQERITAEQLRAYVGTVQEVLIDGAHPREAGVMNGRTDGYRPVSVRDGSLETGDLAQVRITGAQAHWLLGEPACAQAGAGV